MRVFPLVTASALVLAAMPGPAGPAAAAAAAAPGIVVKDVNGSGCKKETTTAALSVDRTAVTVTYSDYVVSAAGSTKTASRNCRIRLKIDPVPGYAPTVTSVDYRGFADLAAGSVVQLAATYRFHGVDRVESAGMRLAGPFSDDWQATDKAEAGLVTGKCTGSHELDVESTLSVTSAPAGAPTDFIAMDSTDAVVPNTFHLAWKAC